MKTITLENGTKVSISEESYKALKDGVRNEALKDGVRNETILVLIA